VLFALYIFVFLVAGMSARPTSAERRNEREVQKWADAKAGLRGTLRALRYALETYLAVERTLPANLRVLIQSPYFPLSPSDIVNPYTGAFPDLVSSAGDPSPAYPLGAFALLTGIRPQIVLMTVFEDRSSLPSSPVVLEEVLTPEALGDIAAGKSSPLLPGDGWKDYTLLNLVDVRIYWQCGYIYGAVREKGFPDIRVAPKKFKKALETWLGDREWFPGPLRRPTDAKAVSWYDPGSGKPPEAGSFTVFRVNGQWIPQCYGLMGRPVSPGLETLIRGNTPEKANAGNAMENTVVRAEIKEGKGTPLP
jgi:hypothetical protein